MEDIGKIQPQAVDLEKAVIGAALIDNDVVLRISTILEPQDFYKDSHNLIWKSILALFNKSEPVDILTVVNELQAAGKLDVVGGAYYISQLTNIVLSAAHVDTHAKVVKSKAIGRQQIKLGHDIIQKAYSDTQDPAETNDFILSEAYNLSSTDTVTIQTNEDLLKEAREKIENAKNNGGITGITTGITKKDELFKGYQPSDLIIKAGRPGMGKTADALCETYHMACESNKKVMFFSLEMSAIQLMNRLILISTELHSDKLKSGDMQEEDWRVYNDKTKALDTKNLNIIDNLFTFNGIRKAVKLQALKQGVDIVYVDYLQLCHHSTGGNREQEISAMSRGFKMLAKELNIPVVVLSQLNRSVEQRGGDKKPMLSDLRESGAIEQDADIVQFLYRPEYYDIMEDSEGIPTQGVGYCIVAKYRNGATEDISMRFIGECIKFKNEGLTEPYTKPIDINKNIEPNKMFDDAPF